MPEMELYNFVQIIRLTTVVFIGSWDLKPIVCMRSVGIYDTYRIAGYFVGC